MPHPDHPFVTDFLAQSTEAMQAFAAASAEVETLEQMAAEVADCLRGGGKLLLAGNGGSAGDAQHIATEFTGRMLYDRPPMAAMALHADSSALTAIGNDYGFGAVFERQVLALGRPGDILLGLSTSGRSDNVLRALAAAQTIGMRRFGFTGQAGGALAESTDRLLRAPSTLTPVIQQVHITAGHILVALVERALHPLPA